ncbi:Ldh family oxidoreductase [Achromobacter sp. NFACC18-2]|uniref:Ldh family oxidoreductase n=1 Tax=Achromobacter sp. NFACC18-2 TaxID=1564112 RepID=UPI0008BFB195|nr:Ldh family oxidoreductase [Achromobacter sp. NFACC18-2]SEK12400.1 ureidoglycolate dehydrogenase (NAD+) [Achromobacter sp. NFACC18-2]
MDVDSRVTAADWERWAEACLLAQDYPADDARCLAQSLAQTSLWGIDSHGIARLPHYLNRVAHGSILSRPDIRVERTGPGTAQVHGGRGQGIVVAHRANALAIELARDAGVAAVGVSDSSHCGAIGLYSRAAARQGMIGIAFTHSDAIAAPFGGHEPFFGTNPISLAFPRAQAEPLCLDMATTPIPWNRVMNARRDGVALPPGVALDAQGQDCTDARAARALRPLGGEEYGYKGYGLAMMVELLCGPLNGNPFGPHISPMYEALDRPRELGAFFIVIDPARFAGGAALAGVVAAMAMELSQAPGGPRLPGDPEAAAQAERRQQGLPVPPGLWAQMQDWSGRLGVALPARQP